MSDAHFFALLGEIRISFEDLCGPCDKAVRGYLAQISRPMEKQSPDRKAKTPAEELNEQLEKAAAANIAESESKIPRKKKSKVIPLTPGEEHVIPLTVDE